MYDNCTSGDDADSCGGDGAQYRDLESSGGGADSELREER